MNKASNKLKDHSRFNRWVQNLDEKDKSLSPLVRKSKWILIMAAVFVLFGLSFIVFPTVKIHSETIEATKPVPEQTAAQSAFELPVDSFENHLKSIIYEKISEEE